MLVINKKKNGNLREGFCGIKANSSANAESIAKTNIEEDGNSRCTADKDSDSKGVM